MFPKGVRRRGDVRVFAFDLGEKPPKKLKPRTVREKWLLRLGHGWRTARDLGFFPKDTQKQKGLLALVAEGVVEHSKIRVPWSSRLVGAFRVVDYKDMLPSQELLVWLQSGGSCPMHGDVDCGC